MKKELLCILAGLTLILFAVICEAVSVQLITVTILAIFAFGIGFMLFMFAVISIIEENISL